MGAAVVADQRGARVGGGPGHQGVVDRPSGDAPARQLLGEPAMGLGVQDQWRVRELLDEPGSDELGMGPLRWCQARQHGEDLECTVGDEALLPAERGEGGLVALVPGREGGDEHAGVGRDHRRICSSVSRTCSVVSA